MIEVANDLCSLFAIIKNQCVCISNSHSFNMQMIRIYIENVNEMCYSFKRKICHQSATFHL